MRDALPELKKAGVAVVGISPDQVAVLDLFVEAAERVVGEIVSAGGAAIAVKCDVLDR